MALNKEETKIIKTKIKFKSAVVDRVLSKDVPDKVESVAFINFNVCDEFGSVITVYTLDYKGEEFNNFWKDFNNLKYLYDLIADKLGLPRDEDPDIEDEIKNEKAKIAQPIDAIVDQEKEEKP